MLAVIAPAIHAQTANGHRNGRGSAAAGPAPSHLEAVAFDGVRRRLVLFGGSRRPGDSAWVESNETWEWDGLRWQRIGPDWK